MIILKIINKKKTLKAKFGINFPDVLLARLQDKTVEPTKETQEIISDEKFDGLGKVTVNPIPDEYIIPEGVLPITENATYDVTKYAKVSTSVHPAPNLQDKSITINENGTQNITFDDGYDGLNQVNVTVNAIEDLTEELNTYNSELTEQETTIEDIIEALKNKGIGETPKYAPQYLSFHRFSGTQLDYEVANLDTSNMTRTSYMFDSCSKLKSLDLSHFNTSNVTTMGYMFNICKALTSLDLSSFDTSNVTNFEYMFSSCETLPTIDVSHFDTSNATKMNQMFYGCKAITSLDLSNFNTSNVTTTNSMFYYCSKLKHLDIRNFDFTKVTNYSRMFGEMPASCEIIVKDDEAKSWVTSKFTTLTNVKTVAELEG